jgi:peptidoglycan L-alanyl-D-glutamate endopeptidase CwlK
MINSRDINELNPTVASLCQLFINKCKDNNIDVIITSTYRDAESQDSLYAQGRTTPGKKVTNAKAWQSYHNFKVAFDFCPVVNGKAQWNDTATFTKCGEIAESLGLEWAGRWKSFKELAHCQYTEGKTLEQLRKLC